MNPQQQRIYGELKFGQVFGFLRVLYRTSPLGAKNRRYMVRCEAPRAGGVCGVTKEVARCQLVSRDTRSCGCQGNGPMCLGVVPHSEYILKEGRVRRPRRRCPVCRRLEALTPTAARVIATGEFVETGYLCKFCQKITRY